MFRTISMMQLEELLQGERDFVLLDVRDREAFFKSHLEGAVNIPQEELEESLDLLPRGQTIIVYCAYGGHSLLAARRLHELGYDVINTSGGLYYYRGSHLI